MTSGSEKSVEQLEAEAAAWAAKLDAAPDHRTHELDAWLQQDAKHSGALLRAQAALALFEPAFGLREEQTLQTRRAGGWGRIALIGTGLAAVAATVATLVLMPTAKDTFETQIGEVRSLALSDGSSVSIDAKSHIDVAFGTQRRDIHLEFGRVLFRAVHDQYRPFRVIVDDVVITDIGTAFQVTDDEVSGEVEVLVTEGAVRVDSPSGRIELVAGQRRRFAKQVSTPPTAPETLIAPADVERALAWREGRIEFDGESLSTAVAQFNRYSRVPIEVGNPALGEEKLYGAFRMDDASGFARAAAASLGTEAHIGADAIVIGTKRK